MSRDPIRNELRGLDNWITREPDWRDWDDSDQEEGGDEPSFFEEPRTYGWSTLNGDEEYGYPSLEAAKVGYRLDLDAAGRPRKRP